MHRGKPFLVTSYKLQTVIHHRGTECTEVNLFLLQAISYKLLFTTEDTESTEENLFIAKNYKLQLPQRHEYIEGKLFIFPRSNAEA